MTDSPSFDQLEAPKLPSHSGAHPVQGQGQDRGFSSIAFSQNYLMNDSAPPLCTDDEVFYWSKVSTNLKPD
jgi:hypothetical protein